MGKLNRRATLLALVLLIAVPSLARADAGTPLMWAEFFHLAIGNALIGIGEGFLLALVFKLPKGKSLGLLILANYFSAWVGFVFLDSRLIKAWPTDLYNAWSVLWGLVGLTYLMTLVLEWPFIALCFKGRAGWLRKSLWGTLLAQTASYALLFGWYWLASGATLFTQMNVVPLAEIARPAGVLVYYISPHDGSVQCRPLDGATDQTILALKSSEWTQRLFIRRSKENKSNWDLMAWMGWISNSKSELMVVQKGLAVTAAPDAGRHLGDGPDSGASPNYQGESTWFNFGRAARLGCAVNSPWNFYARFWAEAGFLGENEKTHARIAFSCETPFIKWAVRNAIHLPNDEVLFQLGEDQICLLEPESRKIALVVKGRGPVAVLKDDRPTSHPLSKRE